MLGNGFGARRQAKRDAALDLVEARSKASDWKEVWNGNHYRRPETTNRSTDTRQHRVGEAAVTTWCKCDTSTSVWPSLGSAAKALSGLSWCVHGPQSRECCAFA